MRFHFRILIFGAVSMAAALTAVLPGAGFAAGIGSGETVLPEPDAVAGQRTSFEVALQPMLVQGATVYAQTRVINCETQPLRLLVHGAGVGARQTFEIAPGSREIQFPVRGGSPGSLFLELKNGRNRILDRQEVKLRDIAAGPAAFSDVVISEGKPVKIKAGQTAAIYAHPARLLADLARTVPDAMRSWPGRAEAVSASAAIDAALLRALQEGVISGEGLREKLKADLNRAVGDLQAVFYNPETRLFRPFPGGAEQERESVWVCRQLRTVRDHLEGNPALGDEFAAVLGQVRDMAGAVAGELQQRNTPVAEQGLADAARGWAEVIPVEIDGEVVYRPRTDAAVADWFVQRALPTLDLPSAGTWQEVNARFAGLCDTHPFLRAFEKTGVLYYLLLNAEALHLRGDRHFAPVFNQIARGLTAACEPGGMVQAPALLGGVYSTPRNMLKFLELLIALARQSKPATVRVTLKTNTGASDQITLGSKPMLITNPKQSLTLKAPPHVMLRQDFEQQISLYDYVDQGPRLFTIQPLPETMTLGAGAELAVDLEPGLEPNDYCAVVAVPAVLSVRRPDDPPPDACPPSGVRKGSGGEQNQLLTLPFRDSPTLRVALAAGQKGVSPGYVLVRHLGNPAIAAAVKIPAVTVTEEAPPQDPPPTALPENGPANP